MVGVIGIQGSLKGPSAISILFPILAMGLPISDTSMAIFRRWVRNLPLSSADRRHVHHLLIGLGLDPRQAALLLYCFEGFLCGVVLLGVALRNETLALVLGLSGCLAFLLILTSRHDELAKLRLDLATRLARGRQQRLAAKVTWEAIQRIELCDKVAAILALVGDTARALGCEMVRITCVRDGRDLFTMGDGPPFGRDPLGEVAAPSVVFRLSSGHDLLLTVALHQADDSRLAADIAFRFLQRLSLATAERLERLFAEKEGDGEPPDDLRDETPHLEPLPIGVLSESTTMPVLGLAPRQFALDTTWNVLRMALERDWRPVARRPCLEEH
jgi:UDP-GlcNAc:undecaprenyl-phosphate GlcNAc-1-phosphate transferase